MDHLSQSYLKDLTQSVYLAYDSTAFHSVTCRVPQASFLGLILFSLYTADIGKSIPSFNFKRRCYADDTMLYGFCRQYDRVAFKANVLLCNCRMNSIELLEMKSYKNRIHAVLYLTTSPCWWLCFQLASWFSFYIDFCPEPSSFFN